VGIDADVERLAPRIDRQMQAPVGTVAEAMGAAQRRGHRAAPLADFQCPDDSAYVAGMDRLRRLRVARREPLVKQGRVAGFESPGVLLLQRLAQLRVRAASFQQTLQKGSDVEPGSSRQEYGFSTLVKRPCSRTGLLGVATRVVGNIRRHHVEQVVRHPRPLLERGLGRPDVHVPVDLHRVGVDDLAVEA